MSLMSNFAVFKTGTYAWSRPSGGSYVAGRWVSSGAAVDSTLDATVQPTTSTDLQNLPEGLRVNGTRTVYTQTAIEIDDRLTIGGVQWKVVHLDEHFDSSGAVGWTKGFVARMPRS